MPPRRARLLALVALLAFACSGAAAAGMSKSGDDRPNRITGTSKADRIYGRGAGAREGEQGDEREQAGTAGGHAA